MEMDFNQLADRLDKQAANIDKLVDVVSKQQGNKSAFSDTAPTTQFPRGAQSIWGNIPVERDIITAHVRPQGIASVLPRIGSTMEQPFFGILTGVTGTHGSRPVDVCDPSPSGYMKACTFTASFGRVSMDTNTIEIDKVALKLNRGDFTDFRLRGRLLGLTDLAPGNVDETDIMNVVTKAEMVIAATNLERDLVSMMWQGDPANNTAGGGYKEFKGLDSQIATGHVDSETNVACPAVDSDVKNFGYDLVGGTGRDIVEYISSMEFYLRNNARRMGLDPVEWAFVMRPELWFELSAVWPCSYLTHRCADDAGNNPVVINDNVNTNMRDDMRNNQYIIVNGNRYPVIVDDGIFEHNNSNNAANLDAGEYASSIYMVPLSITGGFPATYIEHVDYRQAAADIRLLNGKERFWSDDGIYFWAYSDNLFCFKLSMKTEQRVVLRTPHLAGRVDAVKYTPLQHLRSYDPDSPYHADGGASFRLAPWNYHS